MTDRTVLLTGASGFVAKHILLVLLRAGYTVRASLRSPDRAAEVRAAVLPHLPAGAERALTFVTLDLLRDEGWAAAMADIGALVHTASPFPITAPADPQVLIRPAVEGTLRALRAARAAGVGRVVLTSSVAAVQGATLPAGRDLYDESDWSLPAVEEIGAYAASKTLAERAAWDFVRGIATDLGPGIALTTINPSMVLGPPLDGRYGDSIGVIKRLLRGRDPMMPRSGLAIVDVRDVAEAHLRALDRPQTAGMRIIASSGSLWFAQIGQALKAEFPHRRFATRTAPDLMVKALALVDRGARAAVPGLGRLTRVSNRRAVEVLEMTFRPAPEAVRAAARWLAENEGL